MKRQRNFVLATMLLSGTLVLAFGMPALAGEEPPTSADGTLALARETPVLARGLEAMANGTQAVAGGAQGPAAAGGAPAHRGCDPCEPVPLAWLWDAARRLERGYAAAEAEVAAEEAYRSSVRREWSPQLWFDGMGNWGQRLSPSEERVLGVGPRGELRLMGAWTLLDGGRRWRGAAADLLGDAARLRGDAFDAAFRAHLARLYVDAALAEEAWQLHQDQRVTLDVLAHRVQRRLDAGVDVRWEGHLLGEALARSERFLAEADQMRAGARAELSALAGREVRAAPIAPRAERPPEGTSDNPSVRWALRAADARDALARVEADRNGWQLQLVGSTGPIRSRAFPDGPVRTEYLVGLAATWTPDLAGVRRQLGAAEQARARSMRAEAESERAALARELDRLGLELEHAAAREAGLHRELDQARRRLEAATARWEAGVDRWTEVIQAQERVLETSLLGLVLVREIALAHIRYAEASGDFGDLAYRLGQEGMEP
jgi:outer membrane protein TolC